MQQLNYNQRRLILYLYTRENPEDPMSTDQLQSRNILPSDEELSILEEMKYLKCTRSGDYYYFHLLPRGQAAYERFQREIEEYHERHENRDIDVMLSKHGNIISFVALVISILAFMFSVFAYFRAA